MGKMEELANALADLNEEKVLGAVREALKAGDDPVQIVESCRNGMVTVGHRFEKEEYFLSELLMAAEIFKEAMELVKPKLDKVVTKHVGKIVIGTVKGDIHDIGKNIAIALLGAAGFEVHDLGVDIPPEKFVDAIKRFNPEIVGMSCLLTLSIESMKKTVEAIKGANLRQKVKVIIGGGRVDEAACEYVTADAYTDSAPRGVAICQKWVGGK